jgi:hypothetical protein
MGLSRIAPALSNRFVQYLRLIYPMCSHLQDMRAHQQGVSKRITGDTTMFTNTKVAFAAALILGTASAAHAQQNAVKSYDRIVVQPSNGGHPNPSGALSGHARGSYAQTLSTEPTGAARPLTPFERNWFDYQNHE